MATEPEKELWPVAAATQKSHQTKLTRQAVSESVRSFVTGGRFVKAAVALDWTRVRRLRDVGSIMIPDIVDPRSSIA